MLASLLSHFVMFDSRAPRSHGFNATRLQRLSGLRAGVCFRPDSLLAILSRVALLRVGRRCFDNRVLRPRVQCTDCAVLGSVLSHCVGALLLMQELMGWRLDWHAMNKCHRGCAMRSVRRLAQAGVPRRVFVVLVRRLPAWRQRRRRLNAWRRRHGCCRGH